MTATATGTELQERQREEEWCGDLRAHRRSEPQLPCASPGAATGSESFERDSRALKDTAKGCGDLRAHRRSEPQLPCASPGAASTDVLLHVAGEDDAQVQMEVSEEAHKPRRIPTP